MKKSLNKAHTQRCITTRRAAIAVAVLALILVSCIIGPARSYAAQGSVEEVLLTTSTVIPLTDGATFERRTSLTTAGWIQLSVVRVDLSSPYIHVAPVLARGVLTSPDKVTAIAEAESLIAAVNGDFFDIGATGAPLSFAAADGAIIRSPRVDPNFASIAIVSRASSPVCENESSGFENAAADDDADGASASVQGIMGVWRWEGVLSGPGGIVIPLSGMNEISVPANGAVLYDAHWSWEKTPGGAGVSYVRIVDGVVESKGTGRPPASPTTPISAVSPVLPVSAVSPVSTVSPAATAPSQRPELPGVFDVMLRGTSADIAGRLSVGDPVTISARLLPDTPGLLSAFSGKPVLVRDGAVCADLSKHTGIQGEQPAPRTAAGLSEDGRTLLLVVVDGRLRGARGVTLQELASIMLTLGAHDALNLDGGGSSAIAVRDPATGMITLGNRPSGGMQRPVPYVIGISTSHPQESPARPGNMYVSLFRADDDAQNTQIATFPSLGSAVRGDASAFVVPEVHTTPGAGVALVARLCDQSGTKLSPAQARSINVTWSVTPPKGMRSSRDDDSGYSLWVADGTLTALFTPDAPGRYEITASAEGLNSVSFAVRSVETTATDDKFATPVASAGGARSVLASSGIDAGTWHALVPQSTAAATKTVLEDFEGTRSWTGAAAGPLATSRVSIGEPSLSTQGDGAEPESYPYPDAAPSRGVPGQGASGQDVSDQGALGHGMSGHDLDSGPIDSRPVGFPAGKAATLAYDFSAADGTRAAYLRPSEPILLPVGTESLGMWVYGDGLGHWLRATLSDGLGKKIPIDYPRVNWIGWRWVEAPVPDSLIGSVRLEQVYLTEFRPELTGKGAIHIDDIAATIHLPPSPVLSDVDPLLAKAIAVDASGYHLPWPTLIEAIDQFKASDGQEFVVYLRGGYAVDPTKLTVGGSIHDPLEAELLLEMLSSLSDGSTSIVLIQDKPSRPSAAGDFVVPVVTGGGQQASGQASASANGVAKGDWMVFNGVTLVWLAR